MSEQQKIEVDASELRAILDQNKALSQTVQALTESMMSQKEENGQLKAKRVTNRTVTIMFIGGKPVVGLENVGSEHTPVRLYEEIDPRDSKKSYLAANLLVKNLETDKFETIKAVNFAEFIQQGERRECPIVRMRGDEWVVDHGSTLRRELKGNDYKMQEMDLEVPLEVSGVDNYYTVDVDGKELEIFQDYVNMAKSTPRAEKQILNTVNK